MIRNSSINLPWALGAIIGGADSDGELTMPGSNLALYLHGDPKCAKFAVFSDGNHHIALVADGGRFGSQFAEFFRAPAVGEIYSRHGLQPHRKS